MLDETIEIDRRKKKHPVIGIQTKESYCCLCMLRQGAVRQAHPFLFSG